MLQCFQTALQNQIDISACKNVGLSSLECLRNKKQLVNRVGKQITSLFYSTLNTISTKVLWCGQCTQDNPQVLHVDKLVIM